MITVSGKIGRLGTENVGGKPMSRLQSLILFLQLSVLIWVGLIFGMLWLVD
jgi:hypothetical protein